MGKKKKRKRTATRTTKKVSFFTEGKKRKLLMKVPRHFKLCYDPPINESNHKSPSPPHQNSKLLTIIIHTYIYIEKENLSKNK